MDKTVSSRERHEQSDDEIAGSKTDKRVRIYLNAIAPGTVDTSANKRNYSKKQWNDIVSGVPLGRSGNPEEVANIALFLCSHESEFVVGQTIVADGGEIRIWELVITFEGTTP